MRPWNATALVLIALTAPGGARGEPTRRSALALWDEGHAAWERGDLERARARLEASYQASARGRTACDLGRLLVGREELAEAATWFRRCASDPALSEAERAEAADRARHLDYSRATLRLLCNDPALRAEVGEDGPRSCPLALDLVLRPGRHVVHVHGGPTPVVERRVELLPSRVTTLRLEDEPPAPATTRHVPGWAFWTTLAGTAVLAGGTGLGAWFAREAWIDFRSGMVAELDLEAYGAYAAVSALTGLALATAVTLLPYVLRPRPRAPRAASSRRAVSERGPTPESPNEGRR